MGGRPPGGWVRTPRAAPGRDAADAESGAAHWPGPAGARGARLPEVVAALQGAGVHLYTRSAASRSVGATRGLELGGARCSRWSYRLSRTQGLAGLRSVRREGPKGWDLGGRGG